MKEIFKQEWYNLIGAAIEVYNQMGSGFLEEIYQECLEIELKLRGIVFKHLSDNEIAQILNYLKGSEKKAGYLINYGCPTELEWKRLIL